jgi:hypothetical protein
MNSEELLQRLERLDARLVVQGDRLFLDAPAGTVPEELRAALRTHRTALLAAAAVSWKVNEEIDLRDDPRPDLAGDSQMWARLLRGAAEIDFDDPYGLFGALYGVRCCGATLEATTRGWRIVRPEEMGTWEWEDLREQWLMPHKAALKALLAAQGA